jgi:hypothetical protein
MFELPVMQVDKQSVLAGSPMTILRLPLYYHVHEFDVNRRCGSSKSARSAEEATNKMLPSSLIEL